MDRRLPPPIHYSQYLQLDQLLGCQQPESAKYGPAAHDELLFIITHQAYELWFKQLLHEVDHVIGRLGNDDSVRATRGLRRILTILKVLVSQMDVLETMTPLEFASFRERLDTSSGFQSAQFREFEFVLGHKRTDVLTSFDGDADALSRLHDRMMSPSLWHAVCDFLRRRGAPLGEATDVREATAPNETVQAVLIDLYRTDDVVADLCERLVDVDEGVQEWRYRHVKMVERTIGNKPGTGGSSGVDYLSTTLGRPMFPDLWAIRSQL